MGSRKQDKKVKPIFVYVRFDLNQLHLLWQMEYVPDTLNRIRNVLRYTVQCLKAIRMRHEQTAVCRSLNLQGTTTD